MQLHGPNGARVTASLILAQRQQQVEPRDLVNVACLASLLRSDREATGTAPVKEKASSLYKSPSAALNEGGCSHSHVTLRSSGLLQREKIPTMSSLSTLAH